MQQEQHPVYNLVGPSQDHRGKELGTAAKGVK